MVLGLQAQPPRRNLQLILASLIKQSGCTVGAVRWGRHTYVALCTCTSSLSLQRVCLRASPQESCLVTPTYFRLAGASLRNH